jgi:hypothetical protein
MWRLLKVGPAMSKQQHVLQSSRPIRKTEAGRREPGVSCLITGVVVYLMVRQGLTD